MSSPPRGSSLHSAGVRRVAAFYRWTDRPDTDLRRLAVGQALSQVGNGEGEGTVEMMIRSRLTAAAGSLLACAVTMVAAVAVTAPRGQAASPAAVGAASTPRLVAIRATHHPGFDRVVFEFSGSLPSRRHVRYVNRLLGDASGLPVRIAGRAILEASFSPAAAHDSAGTGTAPGRVAFALPNVMTVVRSGDFESVLSHGIGLARKASFHVWTLTHPSRVVIDIRTPFRTVLKNVFFLNVARFNVGTEPYVTAVRRPVPPGTPAAGVMDRLFAGPTSSEDAVGLGLQRSRATGFTGLSIHAGIARVRLTGRCSSGGSTFSIANEIFPTLKQFATVDFVKIYDPAGHTGTPTGQSDSIPECLNP